jgi:hypothetical protein
LDIVTIDGDAFFPLFRCACARRYESMRGLASGDAASALYNHGCRAGTLSHGVAAPLRMLMTMSDVVASSATAAAAPPAAPPSNAAASFALLLRAHFTHKAAALRATWAAWEADAAAAPGSGSIMRAATDAARAALDAFLQAHAQAQAAAAAEAPGTPLGRSSGGGGGGGGGGARRSASSEVPRVKLTWR